MGFISSSELFTTKWCTSKVAQCVWSLPNEVPYKQLMGSIPGEVDLPNYSKIALRLSRIYNTVSIPVKNIPI
jgi:hypothetical protein